MSDQTKAQLDQPAQPESEQERTDAVASAGADAGGESGAPKRASATMWRGAGVGWLALAVAAAAAGASGWLWKDSRIKADAQNLEVTTRLFERDEVAKESLLVSKQAHQAILSLQGKVDVLEGKFSDALTQQSALRTMYQELTRGDDERLIAEVEHAVNLAAQQLAFSGDVPVALTALQSADDRLARSAQSQFVALRKVLNQDMERLKAMPVVDIPGLALKTENIIDAADSMPMAFEEKPRQAVPDLDEAVKRPGWQSLLLDIWHELKQLIRVERVDRLEPVAILPPENAFILRENLKLRLVNARLALLQRDTKTFNEDIRQARAWIERYFDLKAKPTVEALATLGQLAAVEVRLELPKLDATLTALRSTKVNRGTAASLAAASLPPPATAPAAAAPANPPAAGAPASPAAAPASGTSGDGASVVPAPAAAPAKTAEASEATANAATAVR